MLDANHFLLLSTQILAGAADNDYLKCIVSGETRENLADYDGAIEVYTHAISVKLSHDSFTSGYVSGGDEMDPLAGGPRAAPSARAPGHGQHHADLQATTDSLDVALEHPDGDVGPAL
jgi:hypothetical protein